MDEKQKLKMQIEIERVADELNGISAIIAADDIQDYTHQQLIDCLTEIAISNASISIRLDKVSKELGVDNE